MGLRVAKCGVNGTSKGLWLGASGFWGHPVFIHQLPKTQGTSKSLGASLILRKALFRLVQAWRDEQ